MDELHGLDKKWAYVMRYDNHYIKMVSEKIYEF